MDNISKEENCVCGSIAEPLLNPTGSPLCQDCYFISMKAEDKSNKKKQKQPAEVSKILDNMYLGLHS